MLSRKIGSRRSGVCVSKCVSKRDGWEKTTGPRGSRMLGLGDGEGGVSDYSHTDISNSTDNF